MSSIVTKLVNTKNSAYAKELQAELSELPGIAVEAATRQLFTAAVKNTIQYSGRAAFNWSLALKGTPARYYIEDPDVAGVRLKGDSSDYIKDVRSGNSLNRVIDMRIGYMEGFLSDFRGSLGLGVTIYNRTPVRNEGTFKGTYSGNAKIRVAVEFGLMKAEAAVSAIVLSGFKAR